LQSVSQELSGDHKMFEAKTDETIEEERNLEEMNLEQ